MTYYRDAIANGVFLLPLIALLPLLPYYWKNRRRGIMNPIRLLTFYSFVLYALITWYFIVLPLPSEAWLASVKPAPANFLPFSYFRELSEETGFDIMQGSTWFSAVGSSFALQYWFNILMLVPLGMYLRYLFGTDLRRTALISLLTTVAYEVTQLTGVFFLYSKPYRSFDVDDIICNFLGGLIGYWLMGKAAPLVEAIEKRAAEAYRRGTHISILRRLSAFVIDLQIIFVINMLFKMLAGARSPIAELHAIPLLLGGMFLYATLCTLLLKGRTVGKWLLHFRVCQADGAQAQPWRVAARYSLLYLPLIFLALLPVWAQRAGLPQEGMALLVQVLLVLGGAIGAYHLLASWMFPSRDYPWGVLSGTHVAFQPGHPHPAPNV